MSYDINLGSNYNGNITKELEGSVEVKVYKNNKYLLTIVSTDISIITDYFSKYDSIDNIQYNNKDSNIVLYLKDSNHELNISNLVLTNNITLNIELKGDLTILNVDISSTNTSIVFLETEGLIVDSKLNFTYGIFKVVSPNISVVSSTVIFKTIGSISSNLNLIIDKDKIKENILTGLLNLNTVKELELVYAPTVLTITTNIEISTNGKLSVNSLFLKTVDSFNIPPYLLNDNVKRYFTSDISVLLDELEINDVYPTYRIISYYNKEEVGYVINNGSKYTYGYALVFMDEHYNLRSGFIKNGIVYTIEDFEENYKLKNQFDIKILKYVMGIEYVKSKLGLG